MGTHLMTANEIRGYLWVLIAYKEAGSVYARFLFWGGGGRREKGEREKEREKERERERKGERERKKEREKKRKRER